MRAEPIQFSCAYCGTINETRRGGKLPVYCNRWCRGLASRRRADQPFRWVDRRGYVRLEWWDDALGRYVHQFEHRRVWEAANGLVPLGHVIHHVNGDKQDNRLANLALERRSEHSRHHVKAIRERQRAAG